jgi:ABC-type sugar transport system substrate-binding protein
MTAKKTRITGIALSLAILTAGSLPAAGGKQAGGAAKNAPVFGNIRYDASGEWSQLSAAAFEWAAARKGVKVITIPVISNTEEQINGMQNLINNKVDAINVYTATAELDVQLSKMAKDAGIPVSFENGIPAAGAEYVSIATHDWKVLGEKTCAMLADVCKGKKLLLVLGAPGMSIVEPWLEGFMEVYAEKGRPFEIVDQEYTDWGTEKALNVTQDFIQSGRQFDAIFAHNGPMYAGCMSALKDAGLMSKVVKTCGGGQDDELEWLKNGELDATISYLPSAQGIAAFKGLWMYMNGREPPKAFDLPMVPITKANVSSAASWDDFEGALKLLGGLD